MPRETEAERDAANAARSRKSWEPVADRLGDGTRLLQKLRGSDRDFAAALEPDVEEWVRATQQSLQRRKDLLALFDHAVADAVDRARQEGPRAYPRLEAALIAGTRCLSELLSKSEAARGAAPVNRVELARAAYQKGAAVMDRNFRGEGAPTTQEEFIEANKLAWRRVIDWAQETWVMLRLNFPPSWERRFFGDERDGGIDKTGLWLNIERERAGGATPHSCMERRMAILTELLDKFDKP